MRVSAVGWAFITIEETLAEAKNSAEITHNHPEGIKGAQAAAAAAFLARKGESKKVIKKCIEDSFGYNLQRTLKDIRPQSPRQLLPFWKAPITPALFKTPFLWAEIQIPSPA